MKVINLYGGPGTGKSTTAAGLFHVMKLQKMECELVTEYAKDLVWAERHPMFSEQDYIFAKQNHRLRRLRDKVDWVITDSPIVLTFFYMPDNYPGKEHFCNFVREMFTSYDNINVFLDRVKDYNPNGRNQSESEARDLDRRIRDFLDENGLPYFRVPADKDAPLRILEAIKVLK